MSQPGKLIVIAAPSGTGKSTIVNYINQQGINLHFSISYTTRGPRKNEKNGKDYWFVTTEEFRRRIASDDFIEYEEVYGGSFYGTSKSQVASQLDEGQNIIFDVDVNGGINIKRLYGSRALSIFIMPPSIDELRKRLTNRGTDTPEVIQTRLARASYEIEQAHKFDEIVVNDDLETAERKVFNLIVDFLKS